MPISANSVFEIRSTATAANANGGFFVTGATGVDYSQQNAAQYNLTGIASGGAGDTVLSAAAAADMVGNGAHVISGTNFTTGWFEIVSVVVGVSITFSTNQAGASICTGVGADGVINIGGALSLGDASDDAVFENAINTNPGITFWIKGGTAITYTLGSAVAISSAGTSLIHHQIRGYATTRGDAPTGATRPTFACGANIFTLGNFWDMRSMILTGTASTLLQMGSGSRVMNSKFTNTSTSADRAAITGGNNALIFRNEIISYRGHGITSNTAGVMAYCNYIHDCNVGINNFATGNDANYSNNIIASCVTAAIRFTNSATELTLIESNTLYGAENTTGVGISLAAGVTNTHAINNIIYGFTTGISHGAMNTCIDDFNDYFNNDTEVTNFIKGANSITADPVFANVAQVTGTIATTSGSVLTDASKNFVTAGVTAGRDFVYIVSGTGVTVGIYGITDVAATALTLDIAPGTSAVADKVYQITVGRDFSVSGGAINTGYPGVYPGATTTGYKDIGAVEARYGDGIAASEAGQSTPGLGKHGFALA